MTQLLSLSKSIFGNHTKTTDLEPIQEQGIASNTNNKVVDLYQSLRQLTVNLWDACIEARTMQAAHFRKHNNFE